MGEGFTSGSFGNVMDGFSAFHDYRPYHYNGSGYSRLYTVISGERKLFLKAVNPEQGSGAENLSRLQREYKILEKLYGNEHVVRCIGWRDDTEVGPCIVMEYIDGVTLADYLKSSPSNKDKRRVLKELFDAIGFIHKLQIVHNDLKLDNILITRNGHNVKLIDFGYADGSSNINKATGGTEAFASPELLSRKETDCRSDIYSLGFIIKSMFPHSYHRIVRKCFNVDLAKRYDRVSDIEKAMHNNRIWEWLFVIAAVLAIAMIAFPWHSFNVLTRKTVEYVQSVDRYDSIHKAYQDLYDKYEKEIQSDIENGSLKYREFAAFYLDYFVIDIGYLKKQMRPKDEGLQVEFEQDYMAVYGECYKKLLNLYINKLPFYVDEVKDENLRDELSNQWTEEYKKLDEYRLKFSE